MAEEILVTESAAKLAEEAGVSLEEVEGTGTDGRILKSDVEGYLEERGAESIGLEPEEYVGYAQSGYIDESLYPRFRISVLRVEKANLALQLADHNRNMAALMEAGDYRVSTTSILDSPSEFQIIVVLQRAG